MKTAEIFHQLVRVELLMSVMIARLKHPGGPESACHRFALVRKLANYVQNQLYSQMLPAYIFTEDSCPQIERRHCSRGSRKPPPGSIIKSHSECTFVDRPI